MTEHSFIKAVHRQLPPEIKIWKILDDFHNGVSDALYFGTKGRLLFVEYKYFKPNDLPVKLTTVVRKTKLPGLQAEWLRDLKEREVPVCAIIGSGLPRKYTGVWIDDPDEVENGITKTEFLDRVRPIKELTSHISQQLL